MTTAPAAPAIASPLPALAVVSAAEYLDARVLLAFVGTFLMADVIQAMKYRFMLVEGGCVVPRAIQLARRPIGGYVIPMGARAYRGWKISNGG
jgi:hypothetical protein